MRRIHFLTRRAHSRSHHHTRRRRHPKYHRSQSRRIRRTKYSLRRRRGGASKNIINGVPIINPNHTVVANSKGRVISLNKFINGLDNPYESDDI
jgi:hypothetical protein